MPPVPGDEGANAAAATLPVRDDQPQEHEDRRRCTTSCRTMTRFWKSMPRSQRRGEARKAGITAEAGEAQGQDETGAAQPVGDDPPQGHGDQREDAPPDAARLNSEWKHGCWEAQLNPGKCRDKM